MKEQEAKIVKEAMSTKTPFNLYQISGFVVVMLVAISLIHYTTTVCFKQNSLTRTTAQVNCIYDPDHGLNMSRICLWGKDVHKTRYANSPCTNKTSIHWYNPWMYHHVWKKFWKEKEEKRRKVQKAKATERDGMKKETETNKVDENGENLKEVPNSGKEEKKKSGSGKGSLKRTTKPSELLYAILVGLLLMSTAAACWEVIKFKMKKNNAAEAKAQERQCTLASFTINRHLRRESQQQGGSALPRKGSLEPRSKVTQTLIQQSSLDRAFPITSSEAVKSKIERRNSVPAYLLAGGGVDGNIVIALKTVSPVHKRIQRLSSIDNTLEEMNSDARKKPRHFIRRH